MVGALTFEHITKHRFAIFRSRPIDILLCQIMCRSTRAYRRHDKKGREYRERMKTEAQDDSGTRLWINWIHVFSCLFYNSQRSSWGVICVGILRRQYWRSNKIWKGRNQINGFPSNIPNCACLFPFTSPSSAMWTSPRELCMASTGQGLPTQTSSDLQNYHPRFPSHAFPYIIFVLSVLHSTPCNFLTPDTHGA